MIKFTLSPSKNGYKQMERITGTLLILVGTLILGFGSVDAAVTFANGLSITQMLPHVILLIVGLVIAGIGISTLGGK